MEQPELFDLPESLRAFFERGGFRARLAITARIDGRPLVDGDRKALPAFIEAAFDREPGVPASNAFERTPDGEIAWTPAARKVVNAELRRSKKPRAKKSSKRKAAKKPLRR